MHYLNRSCTPFRRALVANASSASYPTANPTATAPNPAVIASGALSTGTDGVFRLAGSGDSPSVLVPQGVTALFFGTGTSTQTFKAMLIGWKPTEGKVGTVLWVPTPIFEVQATLSTLAGVGSSDVPSTCLFADTLSLSSGYGSTDPNGTLINSPTGNIAAHALVPVQGFDYIQWLVKTGTCTDANVLWTVW